MGKKAMILKSAIGGAVLGSALTMLLAPKSGAEMRKMAHGKISEQLEMVKQQIENCVSMAKEACGCSGEKVEQQSSPNQ